MELSDLEQGAKAIACGGYVLNCQELIGLQVGLTQIKTQDNYPSVFFWGKIFGSKKDYYIAYGMKDPEFEFPMKLFYYAGEDFEFKHLPYPSQEKAERIIELGLEMQFTGKVETLVGNPTTEAADGDAAADADGGEGAAKGEDKGPQLTEKDRLAQTIIDIDFDTAVVPRGAHRLNEAHMIVPSADFRGLGCTEATALAKYVHFRPPACIASLRALARTDAEFYANFLDPLGGDLPKGCWAVRQDPSATLVTLRSLSWPGYLAYHVPQTNKYGGLYYGHGQKNRELPFLL